MLSLSQILLHILLMSILNCFVHSKETQAQKVLDMKGVLNLDVLTYNKLIPSDKYSFLILVYSKASIGDYGTDSIRSDYYAFAKKAQTEGESENMIFAQIVVNGADNLPLATSLGVKKNFMHPELFLIQKNKATAIPFPKTKSFRLYELVGFTSKYTDFYLKQAGRTKILNSMREKYFGATSNAERENALTIARQEIEQLPGIEKLDAEYHLDIMQKLNDEGVRAIDEEISKLMSLISNNNGGEKRLHELRLDVIEDIRSRLDTKEL